MIIKHLKLFIGILTFVFLSPATAQENSTTFMEACRKGAQSPTITVAGKENWAFLKSELRFLSAGDFWGENAAKTSQAKDPKVQDPLAAITVYQKALAAENIDLILLPIPPKAVIYPDKLPDVNLPVARYDQSLQRFYDILRKQGVQVFDVTPLLINARKNSDEPLYCLGDSHYSSYGCKVIAEALAKEIQKSHKLSGKQKYTTEKNNIRITGDLYKAAQNSSGNTLPKDESIALYTVKGGETKSKESPILILGDSHTLVFDIGADLFSTNAGFPSLLAAALKMPVEVMGVRGSGATPARINVYRRSKADVNFLKQKKLFIWCFSAREFTEANGWNASVPIK
ncbi:MAG TPA: hypothetical protein IAB03_04285 [Candidatus Gallibacteroides avistercoris]|uniref:AlgX/AlgJ SGNH hydrolase-like domain-containing protein n=1 Tax=Candidatus Gallibacteroides avistercoris TaxID=2840833 RepID=A0A9D1SCZ1_9BACT|nr:hypothetical protein [Candidatus Gallibacteroides avistercoris]